MYVLVRQVDTGADEERLSQRIVSSGLGVDAIDGVTRRSAVTGCCNQTLRAGRSHVCLRQPQDLPEHALEGQSQDVCGPQTDYGFSMFRKIIMHQLEGGHVIGQS
jgi:hypothetical protein